MPKPVVDILLGFKHLYVSEVVRDSKINFQKVPRLGAYMAVPLVYESCLSDEALEALVADTNLVNTQREEQAREKEAWLNDQNLKLEAATAAGEPF